ncbi:MAG: hypothetical protein ACREND_04445 [Gemmatimonadaceae bacterium]
MSSPIDRIAVTYIGGPTVRLDVAGLRLLTDPTFDAAMLVLPNAFGGLNGKARSRWA